MLLLEPRVLLDAAAVVTIDHVADNSQHETQADVDSHPTQQPAATATDSGASTAAPADVAITSDGTADGHEAGSQDSGRTADGSTGDTAAGGTVTTTDGTAAGDAGGLVPTAVTAAPDDRRSDVQQIVFVDSRVQDADPDPHPLGRRRHPDPGRRQPDHAG
ncbi:LEPR-XLL domain-containing protein [Tistlia consotensis]|nr:LEPR-XLL domain-containing protein [Tistlia consotensis]